MFKCNELKRILPTFFAVAIMLALYSWPKNAAFSNENVLLSAQERVQNSGTCVFGGINLFDEAQLLDAYDWTETDGIYSGTIGNLKNTYDLNTDGFHIGNGFKKNTQYIISLEAFTVGPSVTSGNTIHFRVLYTDGTDTGVIYIEATDSWQKKTVTTEKNKTVSKIYLSYSNSSAVGNTLSLRNFKIEEDTFKIVYSPWAYANPDARYSEGHFDDNAVKQVTLKWKKGTVNKKGIVTSDANTAICVLPTGLKSMKIADGYSLRMFCYSHNGSYMGILASQYPLGVASDDCFTFNGVIDNIEKIKQDVSAEYLIAQIEGLSIYNDEQASILGSNVCTAYGKDCDLNEYVPPYFVAPLYNAIEDAKTDMRKCGTDGFSFIFTTDNHWYHNTGHSPALVRAAQQATGIQNVVLGGDLIDGGPVKDIQLELLREVANRYIDAAWNTWYCFGNHDSNTVGQTTKPELHFSSGEVYAATQEINGDKAVYSTDGFNDYYWDDPVSRTRVIVVDSKVEGANLWNSEVNWFNTTLASTPVNYRIIVFMHIWYGWNYTEKCHEITNQGRQISEAINTWNTMHDSPKVIAAFGGHIHVDKNYTTQSGVPIILTTTDRLDDVSRLGTKDEQVVDIVTINYSDNTIYCRRIGRGSDREIAYSLS